MDITVEWMAEDLTLQILITKNDTHFSDVMIYCTGIYIRMLVIV